MLLFFWFLTILLFLCKIFFLVLVHYIFDYLFEVLYVLSKMMSKLKRVANVIVLQTGMNVLKTNIVMNYLKFEFVVMPTNVPILHLSWWYQSEICTFANRVFYCAVAPRCLRDKAVTKSFEKNNTASSKLFVGWKRDENKGKTFTCEKKEVLVRHVFCKNVYYFTFRKYFCLWSKKTIFLWMSFLY